MDEDKREGFEPQQIVIETREKNSDGSERRRKTSLDTEDIIAVFAGIVAVIIALGMLPGWIPVNKLTIGVLSFTGVGAVIAKIIAARKKKQRP